MQEAMESTPATVMEMFAKLSDTPPVLRYPMRILRVVDGDTHHVLIRSRPKMWQEETVRLIGVDCPEKNTEEGKWATSSVWGWFHQYQADVEWSAPSLTILPFILFTHLDKRDKYGRLLGYIVAYTDGTELNQWIVDQSLTKLSLRKNSPN